MIERLRVQLFQWIVRRLGPRVALRVYLLDYQIYHWRSEYRMWRAGMDKVDREAFRVMHRQHERDIKRIVLGGTWHRP